MKPHLQIALALIWRGGEVLVTRRRADADHLAGVWEFPGGKINENEPNAEAARREAREEVGLHIEAVRARDVIEWDYPERRVSLHPFDCHVVAGEPQALEVAAWKWVAPCALSEHDFPPANAALVAQLARDGAPDDV